MLAIPKGNSSSLLQQSKPRQWNTGPRSIFQGSRQSQMRRMERCLWWGLMAEQPHRFPVLSQKQRCQESKENPQVPLKDQTLEREGVGPKPLIAVTPVWFQHVGEERQVFRPFESSNPRIMIKYTSLSDRKLNKPIWELSKLGAESHAFV